MIITYYFPPASATAGYRPLSWAEKFRDYGFETTVITRNWSGTTSSHEATTATDETPAREIQMDGYKLISLPYKYSTKRYIGEKLLKPLSPLRKVYYSLLSFIGEINIDMDANFAFRKYVDHYVKENKTDCIIVSTPPFNLLKLASYIHRKHHIPFVADFRDLWNNNEMKFGFQYHGSDKYLYKLIKKHIRNWINDALLVTVATPPMKQLILNNGYKGKVTLILNGYEEKLYRNDEILKHHPDFTISCIGTMYLDQDLDTFVNGFLKFVQLNPEATIQLKLIGIGFNKAVENYYRSKIPAKYLSISERIARPEAVKEIRSADVLYYAAWKGFNGILSTKIFDYIASQRNVLIAPGDGTSIDELLTKTNTGVIANDSEAVFKQISKWYDEWKQNGVLAYNGNESIIKQYSREAQTEKLVAAIKDALVK